MITKKTFSSFAEFGTWAEDNLVPKYFAACELDTTNNRWTAYRDAEKTQPLLRYGYGWSVEFTAYKSSSVSRTVNGLQHTGDFLPEIWITSNGVMFDCLEVGCSVIITKGNTGETLTVINDAASWSNLDQSLSRFYCTAWGDDPALTDFTVFNKYPANQTQFVPFCSDAPYGSVSYTPDAFYLPQGQFYSIGMMRFEAGGKMYITNGYWALCDS